MISDVLSDAVNQIDRYLAEVPAYRDDDNLHEHIKEVVLQMELLRLQLDMAPAIEAGKVASGQS